MTKRKPSGKTVSKTPPELQKFISGTWVVAHSSLWNHLQFSAKEKEVFQQLIAAHFDNKRSGRSNFKKLIERICLAKRYVTRRKGRYISKPIDWLNIHHRNGLTGTAKWLEEVKEERKQVPEYNKGITTLANGILRYIESPSLFTFYKYRRLLIEQKQYDLLQIFYNTIINLQFLN